MTGVEVQRARTGDGTLCLTSGWLRRPQFRFAKHTTSVRRGSYLMGY